MPSPTLISYFLRLTFTAKRGVEPSEPIFQKNILGSFDAPEVIQDLLIHIFSTDTRKTGPLNRARINFTALAFVVNQKVFTFFADRGDHLIGSR